MNHAVIMAVGIVFGAGIAIFAFLLALAGEVEAFCSDTVHEH